MMTFLIIAIIISILGVLSYFTSARFGVKVSDTDKLPPHYEHLLRRLKEKEKRGEGPENVLKDEVVTKR
ncbi:hypothetical protein EXU85_23420 [Spirosoma sp. KCTC 42546]|uniref:hypothetical protein n=1 Tax=Spirosoma sp. KCTC 42546 TaxID=2520506 RepID=UPI00115C0555|nr:hypothetical protein [Spirosoma sp. KCTC 42546]QDK81397.1 hypothetical protein EXU85_23420 [Spirosoma sp. KCTC 42546]